MEIQPETLILGSNMSSGVTVSNFGKKFAKLRQCEQFEVQENSSENKASVWTNFKNFFTWLTGIKNAIFNFMNFFGSGHVLIHQISKTDFEIKVKVSKYLQKWNLIMNIIYEGSKNAKIIKKFHQEVGASHFLLYLLHLVTSSG